jgi:hypothetical protein
MWVFLGEHSMVSIPWISRGGVGWLGSFALKIGMWQPRKRKRKEKEKTIANPMPSSTPIEKIGTLGDIWA